MIVGNMIGGYPVSPKTVVFRDENGQEIHAVLVGSEKVFTATVNDVREGKTFATGAGVKTGQKVIPAYHTIQGLVVIMPEKKLSISGLQDNYNYTKLQAIVCAFNTSLSNSVSAEKISVDDTVYNVLSTDVVSTVTKNDAEKTIDLGGINESDKPCIIRYFTYREVP